MGDLNTNVLCPEMEISNHLKYFTNLFSLKNLLSTATCTKGLSGTTLDVILTNKPKCFSHTRVFTTGLSDYHKLILSCLRAHFKHLSEKDFL